MQPRLFSEKDSFDRILDHMGSMVEEMLNQNYFRSSARDTWEPALAIYELPDRYLMCVDLAGMEREKIDVRVENGKLQISGVRARPMPPERPENVSVHVMEIDSGKFQRSVPLGDDVDQSKISAAYRNGLLWVTLPRKRE